jgi:pyruvate,water dikinase
MSFNRSEEFRRGKAGRLRDLSEAGFAVPAFVASPDNLEATVETLGLPLAVRSSASAEDGRTLSFAGLFESFLNLQSLEEVAEAVDKCRASLNGDAVKDYCGHNGVDHGTLTMDVIVQRMVQEPELAGVAFTHNPVTGIAEVVIEAVPGLADELLLGHAASLPADDPLFLKYRPAIEAAVLRVARHFGCPQDVEFAVADGRVLILQARPITKIGFVGVEGEWTNADLRDGGVSSTVCSPLMGSLFEKSWGAALASYLKEARLWRGNFAASRSFFGRPYWNLGAVKNCLERLPGFCEREFDQDLGIDPVYEGDGVRTPASIANLLRVIPAALGVKRAWTRQRQFDEGFLCGDFASAVRRWESARYGAPEGFERLLEDLFMPTEVNYLRTIFCASTAKAVFLEAFPDADYVALTSGLPPLSHLEPLEEIRAMAARGDYDAAALSAKYPHHTRRGLDVIIPRWDEDSEWVESLLRQHGTVSNGVPLVLFEEARESALQALPRRRRRDFLRKLERVREFIWLREQMRDLSSKVYHLIRRQALLIAEERELGEDVFFMTCDDILRDDRSSIEDNRAIYLRNRNFAAPNEIGCRHSLSETVAADGLGGIAVSRGLVSGTAFVARTIEEAATVAPGSILICPFTDPGWTPILDRVAGVVTETGGLLSHAAVICREYGIPAVLAVPGATSRIRHGSRITVNGDDGQVELLTA